MNMELLSDKELISIISAIKKRHDIDFSNYEQGSLKNSFARVMAKNKINSVLELWAYILRNQGFIKGFINEISADLTRLFKDPKIWTLFEKNLLPQYKTKNKLSMWHAGCSTGEEVYSASIVLKQLNMLQETKTLVTDLDTTALAQAKAGSYSKRFLESFTQSIPQYLSNVNYQNYFTITEDTIKVKDELKKHIEFRQHNLGHDDMDRKFDIIFCRNIMIYFDDNQKMKVLGLFHQSLEDDGFLVLGEYDLLPTENEELFEVYNSKNQVYKKIIG